MNSTSTKQRSSSNTRSIARTSGADDNDEGQNGNDHHADNDNDNQDSTIHQQLMRNTIKKKNDDPTTNPPSASSSSPPDSSVSTSSSSSSSSSSSGSSSSSEDDENDNKSTPPQEQPKPVSSSSENEEDDDDEIKPPPASKRRDDEKSDGAATTTTTITTKNRNTGSYSRLFVPYRTVGIVVGKCGKFHLLPNQNSAQALVAVPIGDRFQLLRTDKLQPVLVSQQVTSVGVTGVAVTSSKARKPNKKTTNRASSERSIRHIVTDASLSISVVSHQPTCMIINGGTTCCDTVTHFARTQPLSSLRLTNKNSNKHNWTITDMISLGRVQRKVTEDPEKDGRSENTAVIAAILSKIDDDDDDDDDDAGDDDDGDSVPVVGEDDDDDSDSDSDEEDVSNMHDNETATKFCLGEIVILMANRTSIYIHKRIDLLSESLPPKFRPTIALHPAAYLNKILLGGSTISSDDEGQRTTAPALCLVNIRTGKVVHAFTCLNNKKKSNSRTGAEAVSALEQAPAVDTVAVGTTQGDVHLVNLKHDQLLFTLKHRSGVGNNNAAPAVTVTSMSFRTDGSAMSYRIAPMAVGRSDGTITVWDLSPPEDDNDNSDGDDGEKLQKPPNIMGRSILCEMENVHTGGVAKLQYFPQEPLLLSTGIASNSILMHIFDNPDHSARLLRQRRGHSAPPQIIRYLHPGAAAGGGILADTSSSGTDASSCQILSAAGGRDRTLRVFSTARTVLDKEYSQGRGLEKRARKLGLDSAADLLLPPVTDLATSEARSRDWGDLVTIHQNHPFAYVWSTRRGAQSGPILRQAHWNVSAMQKPPPSQCHATSLAISACGSFALVGTKGGTIYKYNVQSGIPRGCYPLDKDAKSDKPNKKKGNLIGDVNRTTKALEKKLKIKSPSSNLDKKRLDAEEETKRYLQLSAKLRLASHTGFAVTGLAVDNVNRTLISVGADGKLILWNLQTHAPHKKSPFLLPSPAAKMRHVRDSDLAAIALADFSVVLFDCAAQSIVRRFGKGKAHHTAQISDLVFSPDGRSLYTASLDSTIRVWDVPTNSCVDWLGFMAPPTSLTVSPTGQYLATTHSGKLGISIWSDRSYYQTVHVDGIDLAEPARMDEPAPISDNHTATNRASTQLAVLGTKGDGMDDENSISGGGVATPLEDGLITLSGLPVAHWKNLFHLELVKERNKPTEAPKKPPLAPFFLQWRGNDAAGLDLTADDDEKKGSAGQEEWDAAWSDDEGDANVTTQEPSELDNENECIEEREIPQMPPNKRRKVVHHRSNLASLLRVCSSDRTPEGQLRFQAVTDHVATLGPSAIDIALSSLCYGMHDLEEGLPLLLLASHWLLEVCGSRQRFDAVNAYLHRFLELHAFVLTGIRDDVLKSDKDDTNRSEEELETRQKERNERTVLLEYVSRLRHAHQASTDELRGKMEHSLCLLRHFSRMV